MPVDLTLIAARLGKPGDLRYSVADCDEKHPTVSAATQANARYLTKWHVDHTPHSQPVLVRLTVSHRRRLSADLKDVAATPINVRYIHFNKKETLALIRIKNQLPFLVLRTTNHETSQNTGARAFT